MSMRVSFELEDSDLRHFQLIMKEACKAAANISAEEIVAAARALLQRVEAVKVPDFIKERLQRLEVMIEMLDDHEWRLPAKDASRVLNALAYFSEPEDLIPDHIPGLGFLDDAIMIELVTRELRPEIDAYHDFCEYRRQMAPRAGVKSKTTDLTREDWLKERRNQLQSRMRRRRKTAGDPGKKSPLRLL